MNAVFQEVDVKLRCRLIGQNEGRLPIHWFIEGVAHGRQTGFDVGDKTGFAVGEGSRYLVYFGGLGWLVDEGGDGVKLVEQQPFFMAGL
ncbi:MAG: hypothetical protein M5U34_42440 [Chloroflexi bacterium]|nr:hypothetical protein [Chloroflexota bacterium]